MFAYKSHVCIWWGRKKSLSHLDKIIIFYLLIYTFKHTMSSRVIQYFKRDMLC